MHEYAIIDSETLSMQYEFIHPFSPSGSAFYNFNVKDHIFFHANADFPKPNILCDAGYRKENNICIDIDECEIQRHYCDPSRYRLSLYRLNIGERVYERLKKTSSRYNCQNTDGSFVCEIQQGKEGSFENTCEEFSITSDPSLDPIDDSASNTISGIYQLSKGIVRLLHVRANKKCGWKFCSRTKKDSNGNPLSGPNNYGIYLKIDATKPVSLQFIEESRLEIKEIGLLGILLEERKSSIPDDEDGISVLQISASEYRNDYLFPTVDE